MNISPLIKSVGKALSKVDWVMVGRVSKELAGAAAALVSIFKGRSKPTASPPTAQSTQSTPKGDHLVKPINELSARLSNLEAEYEKVQINGEEQAKVVSGIADQVSTLSGVLKVLSFRLNIFIALSLVAFILSLWLLIRNLMT